MRSGISPDKFFEKMKKKPALQKILDTMDDYSIEDIEQFNQPKWIREQLVKIKNGTTEGDMLASAEEIAAQMVAASPPHDGVFKTYEIRIWNGSNWFPVTAKGFSAELCPNDLVVVLDVFKIQISSTVMLLNDRSWSDFLMDSITVDDMTVSAYKQLVQQKLNNKYGGIEEVPLTEINNTGNPPNVLSQYGVKIRKIE